MCLGSHAQDSTRNTSIRYYGGPEQPIFKCFLIWVSTSRHQGLFFSGTECSQIPNNFYGSELLNYRATTFLFSSCSTFQLLCIQFGFVYKKLKGMGCGVTGDECERRKVLWPLLDYTHLTRIDSQLELACRKLDPITQYFHSSPLFTRETCNFASSTIKIMVWDPVLITCTPNTSKCLEDARTWELLYTWVKTHTSYMHVHMRVHIGGDAQAHMYYFSLNTMPSCRHSY